MYTKIKHGNTTNSTSQYSLNGKYITSIMAPTNNQIKIRCDKLKIKTQPN